MERSNVGNAREQSNKYRLTFHADETGAFFAYVKTNGGLPFICGPGELARVRREAEDWIMRAVAVDAVAACLSASERNQRDATAYGRAIAASMDQREFPAVTDEDIARELGAFPTSEVR